MSVQPDHNSLNVMRIIDKGADWMRAGREVYKREAKGDHPVKPSDIIRTAEQGTNRWQNWLSSSGHS